MTKKQNTQRILSSINSTRKTGQPNGKETVSLFYTVHKNLLKWIKDLNVNPETIKLLKENIGNNLLNIRLDSDFLDLTQKARQKKQK